MSRCHLELMSQNLHSRKVTLKIHESQAGGEGARIRPCGVQILLPALLSPLCILCHQLPALDMRSGVPVPGYTQPQSCDNSAARKICCCYLLLNGCDATTTSLFYKHKPTTEISSASSDDSKPLHSHLAVAQYALRHQDRLEQEAGGAEAARQGCTRGSTHTAAPRLVHTSRLTILSSLVPWTAQL